MVFVRCSCLRPSPSPILFPSIIASSVSFINTTSYFVHVIAFLFFSSSVMRLRLRHCFLLIVFATFVSFPRNILFCLLRIFVSTVSFRSFNFSIVCFSLLLSSSFCSFSLSFVSNSCHQRLFLFFHRLLSLFRNPLFLLFSSTSFLFSSILSFLFIIPFFFPVIASFFSILRYSLPPLSSSLSPSSFASFSAAFSFFSYSFVSCIFSSFSSAIASFAFVSFVTVFFSLPHCRRLRHRHHRRHRRSSHYAVGLKIYGFHYVTKLSLLLGAVCLGCVRCDSRSCGNGEARLHGQRLRDDGVLALLLLLLAGLVVTSRPPSRLKVVVVNCVGGEIFRW